MTSELVLIRHGETDWNVAGRYQGTSDRLLNDLGHQQAAAVAESMRGESWDAIIASPLKRAWHTALPIAEALGIRSDLLIPDPRLMERSFGVAEGFTLAERTERFPEDTWEGLETFAQVQIRAMEALEEYTSRFPNQRLVMVAHGGWINSVLEVVSNGEYGPGKSVILNTSRTYLKFNSNGWELGEVNVADHLGALV